MRARALAHRVAVAVLGSVIIVVGLVLVPLPGPGWPVVFAGLALLGTEFAWARRLAEHARSRVRRATRWTAAAAWPLRAGVTVALVLCTLGPMLALAPLP